MINTENNVTSSTFNQLTFDDADSSAQSLPVNSRLASYGVEFVTSRKVLEHLYDLTVKIKGQLFTFRFDTLHETIKLHEEAASLKMIGSIVSGAIAGATGVVGLGSAYAFRGSKSGGASFMISATMQTATQMGQSAQGALTAEGDNISNQTQSKSQYWQELLEELQKTIDGLSRGQSPQDLK